MNIAIVGFDTEGRASYDYYAARGHTITICDQSTDIAVPEGAASQLGDGYLEGLERFDVVVRTAGLHPRKIINASPQAADNITSCTNEFIRVSPSRNIIGITGTKGKGTTSSLTTALLQAAGKRVHLGGNIGLPALELLKNDILPDDWVVLELSSFQLIDLQQSPTIAACLMVVPEHLDWHTDEQEYYAAKQQLFRRQTEQDLAVFYGRSVTSQAIASAGLGHKLPYYESPGAIVNNGIIKIDDTAIIDTSDLRLLGAHNWQNVCAALTLAWHVTQEPAAYRDVLSSFVGLEHRLEFVAQVAGVDYYDDSFGTTPETAIVALEAFSQPKVAILGGSDKGASYDALAATVNEVPMRGVVLIGNQAERIRQALDAVGYDDYVLGEDTMSAIVDQARALAQPGDVVLLSTGCASFGMFKNYKDRGNQFKVAVQALAATEQ